MRSEPWAGWAGRAAGAGVDRRALNRNSWPHELQPERLLGWRLRASSFHNHALEGGGDAMDDIEAEAELALLGKGIKGAVHHSQPKPWNHGSAPCRPACRLAPLSPEAE